MNNAKQQACLEEDVKRVKRMLFREASKRSQHDATAAMLHYVDGVLTATSSVRLLPNVTLCAKARKFEFWSHGTLFHMYAESPAWPLAHSKHLMASFLPLSVQSAVALWPGSYLNSEDLSSSKLTLGLLLLPLTTAVLIWSVNCSGQLWLSSRHCHTFDILYSFHFFEVMDVIFLHRKFIVLSNQMLKSL